MVYSPRESAFRTQWGYIKRLSEPASCGCTILDTLRVRMKKFKITRQAGYLFFIPKSVIKISILFNIIFAQTILFDLNVIFVPIHFQSGFFLKIEDDFFKKILENAFLSYCRDFFYIAGFSKSSYLAISLRDPAQAFTSRSVGRVLCGWVAGWRDGRKSKWSFNFFISRYIKHFLHVYKCI